MARIRTIKPEFFTSEDIVSLTPLARLFYQALWCEADREGRLEWKPRTFKLRYLPGDDCRIEDLADELIAGGLVETYSVDGKVYAWIPTFTEHQSINNREADSIIPAPVPHAKPMIDDGKPSGDGATFTRGSRVAHASVTRELPVKAEGKGREGKGTKTPPTPFEGDGAFGDFWAEYPRKDAKQQAIKAWQRLRPTDETQAQIMTSLEDYKQSDQWRRGIIPHAATWLNQGRWMDELIPTDLPRPQSQSPPLNDWEREQEAEVQRALADLAAKRSARQAEQNHDDDGLLGLSLDEGRFSPSG